MGWLKRDFISQAFNDIGMASYVFDLSAEQLQSALRTLDSMMATWNARGIRLGYPIPPTSGGSNLDEDSGVPDRANEAITANLAIRLASAVGKAVSMEMKMTAKQAYSALVAEAALPPVMQLPSGMPAGAGHKRIRRPFLDEPDVALDAGSDSELEFD